MRSGWYRDNYRHSLAARGIRTSMAVRGPRGPGQFIMSTKDRYPRLDVAIQADRMDAVEDAIKKNLPKVALKNMREDDKYFLTPEEISKIKKRKEEYITQEYPQLLLGWGTIGPIPDDSEYMPEIEASRIKRGKLRNTAYKNYEKPIIEEEDIDPDDYDIYDSWWKLNDERMA